LILALTTTPIFALPNSTDPFILGTDAPDFAIAADRIQVQDGKEWVIAYGSYRYILNPEQQGYCTTRKELLSIVRCTKQVLHYLLGRESKIRTDHSSLTWLLNFKDPQGQVTRWLETLSQYNMVVTHRPGKKHINADGLSRIPDKPPCKEMNPGMDISKLPFWWMQILYKSTPILDSLCRGN
jgi:hypothetical protein